MIGLKASVVDFDKWPDLSHEKLEAAFGKVQADLTAAGYNAQWCLTDTGETAAEQVTAALKTHQPDIVLIGAGVRSDPDHFLLFENLINLVHQHAPQAKITFNTNPLDSVEAVQRWTTEP